MPILGRNALAGVLTTWLAAQAIFPAPAVAANAGDEVAILQIRILEGEGAVHTAGSRAQRLALVQVTGETGKPVEGAAVSFRLPEEGPTGLFPNGLKTDVIVTGSDGRVSAGGVQWGRTAGPLRIRVTAVKGQARAGVVVSQYLSEAAAGSAQPAPQKPGSPAPIASRGRGKWIAITALVAGAAAGGLAASLGRGGKAATTAAAVSPAPPPAPTVTVGPPAVTIGRP